MGKLLNILESLEKDSQEFVEEVPIHGVVGDSYDKAQITEMVDQMMKRQVMLMGSFFCPDLFKNGSSVKMFLTVAASLIMIPYLMDTVLLSWKPHSQVLMGQTLRTLRGPGPGPEDQEQRTRTRTRGQVPENQDQRTKVES